MVVTQVDLLKKESLDGLPTRDRASEGGTTEAIAGEDTP